MLGLLAVCGAVLAIALVAVQPAGAAENCKGVCAGWWHLSINAAPTYIAPGHEAVLAISATNLGSGYIKATPGEPVTLKNVLPAGLVLTGTAPRICLTETANGPICGKRSPEHTEAKTKEKPVCDPATFSCTITQGLAPYESIEIDATVKAELPTGTDTSLSDEAIVEGGGAARTAIKRPVRISESEVPFGVENYEFEPEDELGQPDRQAGAHPFQLTTTLAFNEILHDYKGERGVQTTTPQETKNVHVNLPPGFVGNPIGVPQCTELQFTTHPRPPGGREDAGVNECPQDSVVGVSVVRIDEPITLAERTVVSPVFNLVPAEGEPARFGFQAFTVPVTLDTVDNGGDFHVAVNVNQASQAAALLQSEVTVWGVPGDHRHDQARGWACLVEEAEAQSFGKPCAEEELSTKAFLSLPTSCSAALETSSLVQSWEPGAPLLPAVSPKFMGDEEGTLTPTNCGALPFTPAIAIQPEEHSANTPTGLHVTLKVPQTSFEEQNGLAEADLRDSVVTLPEGVLLNPSAANGLAACSESAVGFERVNPISGTAEFRPEVPNVEGAEELAAREARGEVCPKGSKVGTVRVKTPVLSHELAGNVYLAEQEHNPFGSLFALYIVVKDPVSGVVAKLAGEVVLNETTGQIKTTFKNSPQLPFEEFELNLMNGPRASVTTPRACGTYAIDALFQSWAVGKEAEEKGEGLVGSSGLASEREFAIDAGAEGAPCPGGQPPFNPGFVAGTTESQAGAFTPFTLTLTRGSGEQAPTGLTVKLPPGIAGYLSNVKQCPEPQASEGTCGPESLIGSATAVAGLGETPFTETGGRVYVTGPYGGAPFGLSVVIPAVAGPFNFGDVVTRSAIHVDPNTAALTINSTLPTMLNALHNPNTGGETHTGAPVQLRRVDVRVERPGNAPFQFNPTNCSPMAITGTVTGEQGAVAQVSSPFQVKGCNNLAFSPQLEATTNSNYSKVNGTSLVVKVTATPGQANIKTTKIKFPAQLPSRLTTIQKACPEQKFNENPASCPEGSVIGSAIAHTPVLNQPLTGPAYLVSHGNAAFPDAEFVLQGENGVVLVLDGQTDIKGPHGEPCAASHSGCVTSSSFESVPDAPVSTFEVNLPAGPHSAFTGFEDLCKPVTTVTRQAIVNKTVGKRKHRHTVKVRKTVTEKVASSLQLPTILGGQNGDVIEETLPLHVTGCKGVAGFKKAKHKHKHKHKHKKKKHKKKK
ncbi:MAG TPA: hypothetical protein VFW29_03175 [Solirubrobacteraceae bacterium]|nr:hypothetical protein [Solirubrobacteraceae bacterium]